MATQKKQTKPPIDWEARWTEYEAKQREYEAKQHEYKALEKELKRLKNLLRNAPARPPLFGPQLNWDWDAYFKAQQAQDRSVWKSLSAAEYEVKRNLALKAWYRRFDARELERQVFNAGYKAMAAKLHPDHGGNHEDMLLLNEMYRRKK